MTKPEQSRGRIPPAGSGLVKTGLLKRAISFVRDFTAYAGIAGARASALAVIAATFDGVGLLLVPMLSIVTGTETGNTNRLLTQAFDILEAQTRAARITLMLTMFVALVVVRAVARRNINLSRLQADYVEMIRSSLARRLAAAPWPVVSRLQHARVTHLMSGDINRIGPRRTTWCSSLRRWFSLRRRSSSPLCSRRRSRS